MATSSNVLRRKRNLSDDEEDPRRKNPRTERTRNAPRQVPVRMPEPVRITRRMRAGRIPYVETTTSVINPGQRSNDVQLLPVNTQSPELSVSIHMMPSNVDRLDALFELDTREDRESIDSTPNIGSSDNPIELTTPSSSSSSRPILDDLFVINSPDDDSERPILNRDQSSHQHMEEPNSSIVSDEHDDNEVIVVESDDDDSNEDVVVTHQTTLNDDEILARRLQAQFYQESATNNMETFGTSVYSRSMTSDESNGRDLIRDNMEALATRIDNWTVADARRFLMVTFPPGWRGSQRTIEGHLTRTNPMLLYAAIMSGPSAVPSGVSSMGSYEDLLELAEQLGPAQSTGFSKEAIRSIKKRKFKPGCSSSSEDSKESCVICMSDFEPTEFVKTLTPCKHDFHSKCIDPWLRTHKTCPICRTEVQIRN